jgi:hypothetical protein
LTQTAIFIGADSIGAVRARRRSTLAAPPLRPPRMHASTSTSLDVNARLSAIVP